MNYIQNVPDHSPSSSGHGRLIMMVLWAILIAAVGKPSAPQAADHSAVVSLKGLDLSTDQGMQAARDRITATARRLCDRLIDPWSVSHYPDYVGCVEESTTAALSQLQKSTLVASAKPPANAFSAR